VTASPASGGRGRRGGAEGGAGRRAAAGAAALACGLLALAACAKREPPSGGPPDIEPPVLVEATPDSGSARVPLESVITLTFSEGMEPRSTVEAVSMSPPQTFRQRRWRGRTLTLVPATAFAAGRTYTVYVANTARDRHGNPMAAGATFVFTTGDSFPAGRIEGEIQARGLEPAGVYLWCYDAAREGVPDSTGRDFDAVGLADAQGRFRIDGLAAPGRYRVWAFADLNRNRSFEPANDVLAPVDTVFDLAAAAPVASDVVLAVVNPRAPGAVSGHVVDASADSVGTLRVLAVAAADTTLRSIADTDRDGAFELSLTAGAWRLRGFHDRDRDRKWQGDRERASDTLRVEVTAAGVVKDVVLTVPPPAGP
jgi:hypothetical protein